ncbi:MAG: iron ABC transporter permease [Lentisphaeria bacterium]|nr:iron ABC transporter permease [Lentisphaeria bacterium]
MSKASCKFTLLAVLLCAAVVLALCNGNIVEFLHNLQNNSDYLAIYKDIRLPRILGAAAVGVLLAAAGCTVQLLFRNPLSSPHVLGSVNAAALGAVVVMALGIQSLWGMLSGSCAGALLALAVLLFIGGKNQRTAVLLLCGIALNAFASAMMSGVLFVAGERLEGLVFWLLGGFWKLDWQRSILLIITSVAVSVVLLLIRREMNMLYLGENAAFHAGVNTRKTILTAVLCAAVATAAVVGNCGVIGFVGLLVPHIARRIFGGEFARHLLGSALLGALLMILSDWAARTLFMPLEVPIGVLTSLLGAPFFLILILQKAKNLELQI